LPPLPEDISASPGKTYKNKGWKGMGDWLGTGRIANQSREYRDFVKARAFVCSLHLKSQRQWRDYTKGLFPALPPLPEDIPAYPDQTYRNKGWKGMGDWLGKD
jgi:hypothetical protein